MSSPEKLAALLWSLDGFKDVRVITHDNPDPDAIASAAALAHIIEHTASLPVTIAIGGIIGRAENRALMEELDMRFDRAETLDIGNDTAMALVDTQPRAGNTSFPGGRIAAVVIDHHPERAETAAAGFSDIRPEYGACCSILVEYLRAAKLELDRRLATAMFYGIQSETMDLGREVSDADVDASVYLYPLSDPQAISRIRHARAPRSLFKSIHDGLEHAWSAGGVVCVPLGRMDYPDLVAQLADWFLSVEGVEWVIAAGRHHDSLLLSLRTYDPDAHAGELVQEVVGDRGSAGGHGEMAGARIDVRNMSEEEYEDLVSSLFADFCDRLGVGDEPRESLIDSHKADPPETSS